MIAPASRKLGKYEIRQKLGRGGMADVYLAQDTESGQTVALKLIEHSADADTCASIEAEMRGATLQARLADVDPRVVRVYGAGDLEGFFHVAMEYIDGQDLAELMGRGKLEVEFAVDVALAVAQTLENAHKLEASVGGKWIQGIVHGDIKPKNIRIDSHAKVRVLDFGIAKALSLSRKLTRNEFGSVPYASPERLDTGEVNAGSDLWSLSVMLYEMVTGLRPYEAESTERLERMIRSGIAPPPAPDPCPEPLRRILMKALAPDPDLRYQSASVIGLELASFRAGGKVTAADEDIDATRRTFRRAEPDDETRRTAGEETRRTVEPGAALSEAKPAGKPAATKPKSEAVYWVNRTIAATVLLVVAMAAWAGVSDYHLYQNGQAFERQVTAEQITDPAQIWTQWAELSQNHPASIFLRGPRAVARDKFIAAAEHTIERYRNNDGQPVYENEWQRAHTMLLHALSTDPDDKVLHGKLRVCEGQIARIEGSARGDIAQLNDAIQDFQEAQQSSPQSPDPPLGLGRVYLSLRPADVEKATAAFQQAQTNGYRMGPRELSQLADAYRDRANRAWRDSFSVRGMPQEKDEIQRAADDYKRALDLYQQSEGWGNAGTRIAEMQSSLESANTRLQQIADGQNDPESALQRHNRVAGAIIGLIDALRHKSTKKDDQ
ncbi:MAG TPA: serine/threonine-protein kinase [Bryobacteraceae bacterium]|jgi:serine/threonine protein kinase/tetratricopeptide (TPR) repeat protein|nr:serine/threonine-protein kinase [Bryobacteraceae bacterium]